MIYMFKIYDLKELKAFDLFAALDAFSNSEPPEEFDTMEEMEKYIKAEFDDGHSSYIGEPEYAAIVDIEKKKIIKRIYMLNLKVKVFKTDEEIQKHMDLEAKKVKEIQLEREKAYKQTKKNRS